MSQALKLHYNPPSHAQKLLIQNECKMKCHPNSTQLPHGFVTYIHRKYGVKYQTCLRLCKSFTKDGDIFKTISQNSKKYQKSKCMGIKPGPVSMLRNETLQREYNAIGQEYANFYTKILASDFNWHLAQKGFVMSIQTTRRHLTYCLHARLVKMDFELLPIRPANPNYDPYLFVYHPDETSLRGKSMVILVWSGILLPTASACPTYMLYDAGEKVLMVSENYQFRYYPKKVKSIIACKCYICLYKQIDLEKRNKSIKAAQVERYQNRLIEHKAKIKVREEKMKRWTEEKEIYNYLFYDLDWKGKIDTARRELYVECLENEYEEASLMSESVYTVCFDGSGCDAMYSEEVRMSEGGVVSVFSENIAGDSSIAYDVNGDEIASECCDNSRGDTEEGEAREGDYSHVKGSDEDDSESEYTPDSEFNFLNFI
jgi:hypothetical protein